MFFPGETKNVLEADVVLQLGGDYFHQAVDDWQVAEYNYLVFSAVKEKYLLKHKLRNRKLTSLHDFSDCFLFPK